MILVVLSQIRFWFYWPVKKIGRKTALLHYFPLQRNGSQLDPGYGYDYEEKKNNVNIYVPWSGN